MSDPECPGCIEVVRKTLNIAAQDGRDEISAYYDEIPGVKQLRETWDQLKAEGKDPNQGFITITGQKNCIEGHARVMDEQVPRGSWSYLEPPDKK